MQYLATLLLLFSTTVVVTVFANKTLNTIPTIDVSALLLMHTDERATQIDALDTALRDWGFFYVINHNISITAILEEMEIFFAQPKDVKYACARNETNSRGFADDEYTKQKLDLKEIFDIGIVYKETELSPRAYSNQLLDGVTSWPDVNVETGQNEALSNFQQESEKYYNTCLHLSRLLGDAMIEALFKTSSNQEILEELKPYFNDAFDKHASFLRFNYYPIQNKHENKNENENKNTNKVENEEAEAGKTKEEGEGEGEVKLGVNRHTDAGILTILLQDPYYKEDALEVYSGSKQDYGDGEWVAVKPPPGTLTVNLGDMMQVWSNNRYKAAEHRVRATNLHKSNDTTTPSSSSSNGLHLERYSAPFFFNPAYDTMVHPTLAPMGGESTVESKKFKAIRWGDYRAQRFAGDFAPQGDEIQIEHFTQDKEEL